MQVKRASEVCDSIMSRQERENIEYANILVKLIEDYDGEYTFLEWDTYKFNDGSNGKCESRYFGAFSRPRIRELLIEAGFTIKESTDEVNFTKTVNSTIVMPGIKFLGITLRKDKEIVVKLQKTEKVPRKIWIVSACCGKTE